MESIKEVLIRRDVMLPEEADDAIQECKDQLMEYIEANDMESAMNICQEFFGLEPDYLDELMPI